VDSNAKKYTILYAEDMDETQQNYGAFLEDAFRKVFYAADGEEAWELYTAKKPDVLLLDINMPRLDGLALAQRIRENDRSTKLIMLTAYADQEKLLTATELHLTKYLQKPVRRNDFKAALNKVVEELESERQHNDLLILDEEFSWNRSLTSLFCNGEEVSLTKSERLVLTLLASEKKSIYSTEDFASWFYKKKSQKVLTEDGLKGVIKRLRKKLPQDAIDNVFGVGYRFHVLSS
jgi:DNA-binding response OmpR family regulator